MSHLQSERAIVTGGALVEVVRELAGTHPGYRAAHARGLILHGTFRPTKEAGSLSIAPHFNNPETPIIGRFSDSPGDPTQAENGAGNKPKGFAVRFQFPDGAGGAGAGTDGDDVATHTDIATVTVDGFPVSNGDEALEFFHASRDGTLDKYLPGHPKAQAYFQLPNPWPASFASARYFGVNAVRLIDRAGKATFVRYRIEPVAGVKSLSADELKKESATYLVDGVPGLVKKGPIQFRFTVQVAEHGDVTDDCNVHWPESRRVVELGTISLDRVAEDSDEEQKHILFNPRPRGIPGLEPSGDPLLGVRSLVYSMSAHERGALQ